MGNLINRLIDGYKKWLHEIDFIWFPLILISLIVLPAFMHNRGYFNLDHILMAEAFTIIFFLILVVPLAGHMKEQIKKIEKQKKSDPHYNDYITKRKLENLSWNFLYLDDLLTLVMFVVIIGIAVILFEPTTEYDKTIIELMAVLISFILVILYRRYRPISNRLRL